MTDTLTAVPPEAAADHAADTKRRARNRRLQQLGKHKRDFYVGRCVNLERIAEALYSNGEADLDDLRDEDSIKHAFGDWVKRLLDLEGAPDFPVGTYSRDGPLGS